jgi:hypothetical protein
MVYFANYRPTLDVQMGLGEYVFGTSLGILRSENAVDYSLVTFSPILTETAHNEATEIDGDGYSIEVHLLLIIKVRTTCECIKNSRVETLIQAGVPAIDAPFLLSEFQKIVFGGAGMAVSIGQDENNITIYHIHTGLDICGGAVISRLCLAKLNRDSRSNLRYSNDKSSEKYNTILYLVKASMRFISEGEHHVPSYYHPTDDKSSPANITWITVALRTIFGGKYAFVNMPPVYPGAVNSLLWWTTGNMQVSNPSFFEAGTVFGHERA